MENKWSVDHCFLGVFFVCFVCFFSVRLVVLELWPFFKMHCKPVGHSGT